MARHPPSLEAKLECEVGVEVSELYAKFWWDLRIIIDDVRMQHPA